MPQLHTNTKITILGSGTCVPQLHRSASAVLIENELAKILFDLGPGTIRRLLHCGISIFQLTHIFLSHFHPDHSAELISLIFATKYPKGNPQRGPLYLCAGKGLRQFYQGLQSAFDQWIVLPEEILKLHEIDPFASEKLCFDGFEVTARPMNHCPESLAYRFLFANKVAVACSGDTDECEQLIDVARNADLFICESAMPDNQKVPGHLTPALAGHIAAQAQAKRLVLTHLYPPCDQVDIVKQARKTYKGEIIKAEDLMTFELK